MNLERVPGVVTRALACAGCVALGLLAIAGSGGGAIGFPEVDPSRATYPTPPPEPGVWISPGEPTVQAGTIVRFESHVYNALPPITYQWRRDGIEIAGATSDVYLLNGAQLADDLARFQVIATAANGLLTSATLLHVSSAPPVVFQDADFPSGAWSASVASSSNGATYTASQSASGGNPGPYRLLSHQLQAGVGALQLLHRHASAIYAPATHGAVYTIDFTFDCAVVGRSAGLAPMDPQIAVTFEQAGRLYQLERFALFCGPGWKSASGWSVQPDRIALLSGPPCGANERCPDLTVNAAPLQFGFATWVRTASASAAGTLDLGIDNWKVTVWRH